MVKLSISWSGDINRPGLKFLSRYPRLPDVYRGVSQFAGALEAAGFVELAHIRCDEEATTKHLPGTHDDAEILYACGHGEINAGRYELCLHDKNWSVANGSLGGARLCVAIFDSCNLIDTANGTDVSHWNVTGLGPSIRLLLGFDGLAYMMRSATNRGLEFANNLVNGMPIADAWVWAVRKTTIAPYNRAVAIGIGDSVTDAQSMLNVTLTGSLPGSRVSSTPVFEKRY